MNRVIGILGATLLCLLLLVPAAAAADPFVEDGRVVIVVGGDAIFPAGDSADSLIVVDGHATVEGDVRSVFAVNATVAFVGSRSEGVVAITSTISLDPGSVVTGDIRTISTTVQQAPGATIGGGIIDGLDLARAALFIGPALFLLYVSFVVAAIAAAVALAGLATRQVRSAEALISREPGTVFVAGLAGVFGIAAAGTLAVVTIVGIPLGLGILVGFLPLLAFVGYLVAGIWVGDWILRQSSPTATHERPYLAAVVGILALAVISLIPMVGGLVSFMGLGSVVLLMWRNFRRAGVAEQAARPVAAATPG
jgi:hypothetical protein